MGLHHSAFSVFKILSFGSLQDQDLKIPGKADKVKHLKFIRYVRSYVLNLCMYYIVTRRTA